MTVGDEILSRPEDHPNATARASRIEKVFELSNVVMEIEVGGKQIVTTTEHPFYVSGKGWTPAKELAEGDLLVGHDNRLTPVSAVRFTDRTETVYNLRVAIDHTFFVGDPAWGFSVWVHNIYFARKGADGLFEIVNSETGTVSWHKLTKKQADDFVEFFNTKGLPAPNRVPGIRTGKWGQGSFGSAADSLSEHFRKHGAEVGAKDIDQYLRKAEAFAQNLRGATKSAVEGATPGVTRYKKLGKYIDIDGDGNIISFGLQ